VVASVGLLHQLLAGITRLHGLGFAACDAGEVCVAGLVAPVRHPDHPALVPFRVGLVTASGRTPSARRGAPRLPRRSRFGRPPVKSAIIAESKLAALCLFEKEWLCR
jgi:hypothetical protein